MSATWLATPTSSDGELAVDGGLPRCVVFDLDGTLTGSKVPIERPMAEALLELVRRLDVGIVTGGRYKLIEAQVLPYLDELGWSDDDRRRLHLLPACGTQRRRWDGRSWHQEFREDLDPSDRERVPEVLIGAAKELGLFESRQWGDYVDDRGGQITYSVFGQTAPLEVKQAWDPDGTKKERIRLLVAERLPHLSVASGASSSIDVTRPGRDKAFGVERLAAALGVRLGQLVFVGDRLQDGGNDASLHRLPVALVSVQRPSDTLTWARELVDRLDGSRIEDARRPRDSMSGHRAPAVSPPERDQESPMNLDATLLEILVCPDCRSKLSVDDSASELVCNGCGLAYPVRDDIPVMLVEEARRPDADSAESPADEDA